MRIFVVEVRLRLLVAQQLGRREEFWPERRQILRLELAELAPQMRSQFFDNHMLQVRLHKHLSEVRLHLQVVVRRRRANVHEEVGNRVGWNCEVRVKLLGNSSHHFRDVDRPLIDKGLEGPRCQGGFFPLAWPCEDYVDFDLVRLQVQLHQLPRQIWVKLSEAAVQDNAHIFFPVSRRSRSKYSVPSVGDVLHCKGYVGHDQRVRSERLHAAVVLLSNLLLVLFAVGTIFTENVANFYFGPLIHLILLAHLDVAGLVEAYEVSKLVDLT